jgi:hypothetical protein
MHPLGRAAFNELHGLGDRHRRGQRQQQMKVILDAADAQGLDSILAGDAAEVRPKPWTKLWRDDRSSLLGAEDTMRKRAASGCGDDCRGASRAFPLWLALARSPAMALSVGSLPNDARYSKLLVSRLAAWVGALHVCRGTGVPDRHHAESDAQRGIISEGLFAILVIMAVVTTLMASPIFDRLLPGMRREEKEAGGG